MQNFINIIIFYKYSDDFLINMPNYILLIILIIFKYLSTSKIALNFIDFC